jgi:hypothetical protein
MWGGKITSKKEIIAMNRFELAAFDCFFLGIVL